MKKHAIRKSTLVFILVSPIGLIGCASMSSTPLSRGDDNSFIGDSNGKQKIFCRARPYKGTPVKVKVQTHVDVFVDETYYLKRQGEEWSEHPLPNRIFAVRTAPVVSEQIVMVDFKRPASGTLNLAVEFNDQQYFKSIDSKLVDTTLKDTADLIGQAVKITTNPRGGEPSHDRSDPLLVEFVPMTRTVAYQRFDINAADYESQVDQFISEHLNNCNSCVASPSYDASVASSRVGG